MKSIIFDWGRTLYDPDAEDLFAGVREILPELAIGHRLFIVSLASKGADEIVRRKEMIKDFGIEEYFDDIFFAKEDKDFLYEELYQKHALLPNETAIIDDRMIRGVAWGNRQGATTVWFRNGKFANEIPTKETGDPTYIISQFTELENIFSNKN